MIYYFQPDKEKSWTRLLAGHTDVAIEISPKNYKMLKDYADKFYFYEDIIPFYTILLYNTADPLFSDPAVRTALTHAIDREKIVNEILKGYGSVAVSPVGIQSQYHDPAIKPLPYDPKKSLKLLQKSGWTYDKTAHILSKNNRYFEFTLFVMKESQIEKNVAQFIKLSLNDIGIKIHIEALEVDELKRRYETNNEFQAVITEFVDAQSWMEYFVFLWSPYSKGKSIAGCFKHKDVTRLLHEAMTEQDITQKKELMHQVESLLVSLQPGTCLYHRSTINVMSKRFKPKYPLDLTYGGTYRLRYVMLSENYK
jgi:peptide/nickel transport system substrate-binding protein